MAYVGLGTRKARARRDSRKRIESISRRALELATFIRPTRTVHMRSSSVRYATV